MAKELSQTFLIAAKSMRAALTILKKNGGSMPSGQLMDLVGNEVEFSDWEKETTSRGGIRWQNVYHFSSVDYVLAGFLIKKNGIWYLTPEGEKALSMPPEEMHKIAQEAYRKWKRDRDMETKSEDEEEFSEAKETILNLEELEDRALTGIREYIRKKNPYDFQELVAALLRAMDYHTPFVAPRGKDGGVDVLAYVDPLGAQTPRIKVQVKHYPDNPIGVK